MTAGGEIGPFASILEKARTGGPYIGPRGGKWADPQHKIAWKEPQMSLFGAKPKPKPKPKPKKQQLPKDATPDTPVEPDRTRFQILAENMGRFEAKIKEMTRRANRIGVEPPTITRHGAGKKTVTRVVADPMSPGGSREVKWDADYYDIEVQGPKIQIGGWRVRAKMEPVSGGGMTVQAVGEGAMLPHELWNTTTHCDHCGTDRQRKRLFALQSDKGKWMQIGTSCLSDFTGLDPKQAASAGEWLGDWKEDLEEDLEGWEKSSRSAEGSDMLTILKLASWIMDQHGGFVSARKAEDENRLSTSTLVKDALQSGRFLRMVEEGNALHGAGTVDPIDRKKHTTRAEATLAWASALPEDIDDEFLRNIRSLAHAKQISSRHVGMAAAAHVARERHERAQAEKARKESSGYGKEFFGSEGDKIGAKRLSKKDREAGKTNHPAHPVTLERTYSYDTDYGRQYYGTFHDDAGRVFKVKLQGSNYDVLQGGGGREVYLPYTKGETFNLRGTIKKQDSWKDIKQTHIIRAKLERVLSEKEREVFEQGRKEMVEMQRAEDAASGRVFDPDDHWSQQEAERAGWDAVQAELHKSIFASAGFFERITGLCRHKSMSTV